MSDKRCVLIGAGVISNFDKIASLINMDDYIICADGGYINAKNMGLSPNLILGDFDSSPVPNELTYNVKRFSSDKDQTDLQLAMLEGFSLGYNNFLILGATGGRLDHTYGNLQLLAYADKHDSFALICDEKNKAFIVSNKTIAIKREAGKYVSIFAYGGNANGVTLEGFKYEVKNEMFSPNNPIGVSNEIIDFGARITVEKGSLLIIMSED